MAVLGAPVGAGVGLAGGWIIAVEVEANELAKFVGLQSHTNSSIALFVLASILVLGDEN